MDFDKDSVREKDLKEFLEQAKEAFQNSKDKRVHIDMDITVFEMAIIAEVLKRFSPK